MPEQQPAATRLLAAVLESTPSALAIYVAEAQSFRGANLVQVNAAFTAVTGYTTDDLLGTGAEAMTGPLTDHSIWRGLLAGALLGQSGEAEVLHYRKDGSTFWDHVQIAPVQERDGTSELEGVAYWLIRHSDVSELRNRTRDRARQVAFLSLMAATVPFQTAVLDGAGLILAVNDAWRAFWVTEHGAAQPAEVGSNYLAALHEQLTTFSDFQAAENGIRGVIKGLMPTFSLDYEYKSSDQARWYQLHCTGIAAAEIGGHPETADLDASVIVTHIDITRRKATEAELARRSLSDMLTGLANRAGLITQLASRPRAAKSSVVLLDLDNFKSVNDSFGHSMGDELLVVIGVRITDLVGSDGIPCRLGGDSFVVYLPDLSPAETLEFATTLLATVATPMTLGGGSAKVTITASAGIAHSTTSDGIETQLRDADSAMYRAKEFGRGQVEIYSPELYERARRRVAIEAGLRLALSQDEFVLHFQPVVDLATGRTCAQEALIRWQSPEGLLAPGDFLDVAVATGLIRPIGHWVIRESLRQAAAWQRAGRDWVVHVNLSPAQLRDADVVRQLADALRDFEVDGSRVCLEITETELLPTIDGAGDILARLHETGAGLALDDFGVGYFSLSHLIDLPVTMLKIDRSFVQGLDQRSHVAVVSALTMLSGSLDLGVVAEGLETQEQVDQIHALGCRLGQGYFLGRPTADAVPGRLDGLISA